MTCTVHVVRPNAAKFIHKREGEYLDILAVNMPVRCGSGLFGPLRLAGSRNRAGSNLPDLISHNRFGSGSDVVVFLSTGSGPD